MIKKLLNKWKKAKTMKPEVDDDAFFDHGDSDILGDTEPLDDEEGELFVLFAEALDPDNPKTIEEVEREWEELL